MAEPDGELTVGVLGPFAVAVGGRPVALSSGRLRTLVAVLALAAGRPVTVDRLATALWSDDPPANPRRTVQTYLTRLRTAIGAEHIITGPTGYQLHVDPDRVDALQFTRLLDQATARDQLTEALNLWRGTPFHGIQSTWLERTAAPRLLERYLAAVEQRIDLDLAEERHGELVVQLRELTNEHPLRESLWVRLLVVLDRCGRPAEALEQYQTIRLRLADELGTDPGPELQRVYADLLAGTARGRPAPAGGHPGGTGRTVPRQLPAGIAGFTGRAGARAALDDLISEPDGGTSSAMVIAAIAGTAGVGKTALALHWAHRVADRFPDGQLYVNLRGYHPSGKAVEPAEAIRGFLEALDVPPQRMPPDPDAQAGLYRSLLAGRRVLVMLDNARDADQVRPLLPGSPGSLVVVTSRDQLTSLVATAAARPLTLELLSIEESRELLARRLGADRIAAEPAATDEIIASCARLPLALAIAAAHAATQASFPLATLAARLREARSDLDAFAAGDPATDARAAFSWSYRTLTTEAARLFRLLGLHPGPDLAAPAAASLAGLPMPRIRPLLTELTRAHLLTEHAPGRYAFHDLLRSYATELVHAHDPDPERRAAQHRLLDHYLHTAHAAARLLHEHRRPITVPPPQPGVSTVDLADHAAAMAWFAAERGGLLGSITQAAAAGFDPYVWQLAWTLDDFFHRRGHWHEWAATQRAALDAATRLGETAAQAHAHRSLGNAYTWLESHDLAGTHYELALRRYGECGDVAGQIRTHYNAAGLRERQGRHRDALRHAQRALELSRASGDRTGEATALNVAGWGHAQLGDHQQALADCGQALRLYQELGDLPGQATTWHSLGYAHHQLGEHRLAIDCHQHALRLSREIGNRYIQTEALTNLGDAQQALGDLEAARAAWRAALTILEDLGHPDADPVRARLESPADLAHQYFT